MPPQLAPTFPTERKLSLRQASRVWPTEPRTYAVARRACLKGLRCRNGARVHLEHVIVRGVYFTSREAIARFFQTVAEADAVVAARANGELAKANRRRIAG